MSERIDMGGASSDPTREMRMPDAVTRRYRRSLMSQREGSNMPANVRGSLSSSRRTRCVWALFAASMTAVGGTLLLLDGAAPRTVLASTTTLLRAPLELQPESVAPVAAPLDRERWTSIVIHHSGLPAGNAASIERHQQAAGISGLGYHFVIGNGHGFGDGEIHVGYRWSHQLPGAHVAARPRSQAASDIARVSRGPVDFAALRERSIGICLVGNGDRSDFTPRQLRELVSLVRALQRELGIPATQVFLHRDLADVTSPGERFPAAEFESRLLR